MGFCSVSHPLLLASHVLLRILHHQHSCSDTTDKRAVLSDHRGSPRRDVLRARTHTVAVLGVQPDTAAPRGSVQERALQGALPHPRAFSSSDSDASGDTSQLWAGDPGFRLLSRTAQYCGAPHSLTAVTLGLRTVIREHCLQTEQGAPGGQGASAQVQVWGLRGPRSPSARVPLVSPHSQTCPGISRHRTLPADPAGPPPPGLIPGTPTQPGTPR